MLYVMLLCGSALLGGEGLLLGAPHTDLYAQFLDQRQFAFGELAKGNVPLWNPHIFSGMPGLGNIQLAMFYPANLLYLFLQQGIATNTSIILHLSMAGIFMGAWIRSTGIDLLPSLVTGILYLGCGAHFPHVYAGHLTMLCLLPWAPILFWSVDAVARGGGVGSVLSGALALTLMVLAGYPQFVFHLGAATALYAVVRLRGTTDRLSKALRLSAIPILGLGLSAFQLAATVHAGAASVRGDRLTFEYASMFSFPPENLLTLLAPFPFGASNDYWGRAYLWEMELFLGITTLSMVGVALSRRGGSDRGKLACLAAFLLVLALGKHTPLFRFLFDHVPGFDLYRGHSKWILPASLILLLLAAQGFHLFLRAPDTFRCLPRILAIAGGSATVVSSACLWSSGRPQPFAWWTSFLGTLIASGESYALPSALLDSTFPARSLSHFGSSLAITAATLLALALAVAACRRRPVLGVGVAGLAVLEIFLFDRAYLTTFALKDTPAPEVKATLSRGAPADYRVASLDLPNIAMSSGAHDIWGYDPFVPRRYAEFMAFVQGVPLDTPAVDIPLRGWDPLLGLLRLRYVFVLGRDGTLERKGPFPHLPHALLVPRYRVVSGNRGDTLAALREPGFDPTQEVILEVAPSLPLGKEVAPGAASARWISTDELLVQADAAGPSLLLLTDPFFPGWRAEAADGPTAKAPYPILRADYVLQAIPLSKGKHSIRMVFRPPHLTLWVTVSAATALVMCGMGLCVAIARFLPLSIGDRNTT